VLGQLNVAGGNIHSIALNAAFAVAAADETCDGTRAAVLTAARQEYRKLQKPLAIQPLRQGA
jgi:hypothetical protein